MDVLRDPRLELGADDAHRHLVGGDAPTHGRSPRLHVCPFRIEGDERLLEVDEPGHERILARGELHLAGVVDEATRVREAGEEVASGEADGAVFCVVLAVDPRCSHLVHGTVALGFLARLLGEEELLEHLHGSGIHEHGRPAPVAKA